MLAEGTHKVKIVGCFTGESGEKNTPYYGIEFETLKDEQSINWLAYLTDSKFTKDNKETTLAKENMKTLVKLGFQGRSISDLSDTSKAISDLFIPVDGISIVVEHEEFTDNQGEIKTAAKVKWVNVGYGPNKFDHKQSVVKFKSLNLDGELLKLQKELGPKKKSPAQQQVSSPAEEGDINLDDVPF